MSEEKINTPEFWDRYMREEWVPNAGREQTRLFAHYFLEQVPLPARVHTLLDCSCAMGDAIPEFHRRRPDLVLSGTDVSPAAIEVARSRFGDMASFSVASLTEIVGSYDAIYCSNTLEHFENYLEIASSLLNHAPLLYVLVPYIETRDGRRLSPQDGAQHVVTFDRRSFDPLVRSGVARLLRRRLLHAPGAWGHGPYAWTTRLRGWLTRDSSLVPARQIAYELERVGAAR